MAAINDNLIQAGLLEITAFGGQPPDLERVGLENFLAELAKSRYRQELLSDMIARGILKALDVLLGDK